MKSHNLFLSVFLLFSILGYSAQFDAEYIRQKKFNKVNWSKDDRR